MNLMNCCCCPKGAVDIALLVDTSGSMEYFIDAAQVVFDVLTRDTQCKWLIGEFKDRDHGGVFATDGVNIVQSFTFDISQAAAAVDSLVAYSFGDFPEQGYMAIKYVCDNWVALGGRGGSPDNPRIIVVISDAANHNGGLYPTRAQVETALSSAGVTLNWIADSTEPDDPVAPDNLSGSVSYLCNASGGELTILSVDPDLIKNAMCSAISNAT